MNLHRLTVVDRSRRPLQTKRKSAQAGTIYLCGPIAESGQPAKGGYQSCNRRIIDSLRRRGGDVRELRYAQPEPSASRIRKWVAYFVGFSGLALKLLACRRGSLVHITGLRRAFLYPEAMLIQLAKMRSCSTIYDIRDGLDLDLEWIQRSSIYEYCFGFALNSVDKVMVEGASQVTFVESYTGTTPVLMPNHVDVSVVPVRSRVDDAMAMPSIAYAGSLKPEKGIDKILAAADILRLDGFQVAVRIAGSGNREYVEGLKRRFPELTVEWLGAQSAIQVLELFSSSHFFVFPTWWPGEGQSNALTEAMACGCVPIVSDHGFNATTVADSGAILQPNQAAEDYASALRAIWDGGRWSELSQRSVGRAREFYSSRLIMDRLVEEYVSLDWTLSSLRCQ